VNALAISAEFQSAQGALSGRYNGWAVDIRWIRVGFGPSVDVVRGGRALQRLSGSPSDA
jgi:hypothetical protein